MRPGVQADDLMSMGSPGGAMCRPKKAFTTMFCCQAADGICSRLLCASRMGHVGQPQMRSCLFVIPACIPPCCAPTIKPALGLLLNAPSLLLSSTCFAHTMPPSPPMPCAFTGRLDPELGPPRRPFPVGRPLGQGPLPGKHPPSHDECLHSSQLVITLVIHTALPLDEFHHFE